MVATVVLLPLWSMSRWESLSVISVKRSSARVMFGSAVKCLRHFFAERLIRVLELSSSVQALPLSLARLKALKPQKWRRYHLHHR